MGSVLGRKPRLTGFTLVELLVAIALIAIIAAIAAPSFTGMLDRKRVEGLAVTLMTDLQVARTEALKRNQPVRVTFNNGSNWSYSIATEVSPAVTIKTVSNANHPSTSIVGAFENFSPTQSVLINQRLGMPDGIIVNDDGVIITGASGSSLRVIVNQVGRVGICGDFGGYPACP